MIVSPVTIVHSTPAIQLSDYCVEETKYKGSFLGFGNAGCAQNQAHNGFKEVFASHSPITVLKYLQRTTHAGETSISQTHSVIPKQIHRVNVKVNGKK